MGDVVAIRNESKTLRVLIMREGDVFVGQCIDHDICTQADDMETLFCRMESVITGELDLTTANGGEPFAGIPPAPDFYRDMWDSRGDGAELRSESNMEFRFAA